jgi:hypothetical protein
MSSLVEYLEFNPQACSVFPGVAAVMGLKTAGHQLGALVPLAVGGLLVGGNAVAPQYFGTVPPKKKRRRVVREEVDDKTAAAPLALTGTVQAGKTLGQILGKVGRTIRAVAPKYALRGAGLGLLAGEAGGAIEERLASRFGDAKAQKSFHNWRPSTQIKKLLGYGNQAVAGASQFGNELGSQYSAAASNPLGYYSSAVKDLFGR